MNKVIVIERIKEVVVNRAGDAATAGASGVGCFATLVIVFFWPCIGYGLWLVVDSPNFAGLTRTFAMIGAVFSGLFSISAIWLLLTGQIND